MFVYYIIAVKIITTGEGVLGWGPCGSVIDFIHLAPQKSCPNYALYGPDTGTLQGKPVKVVAST